MTAIVTAGVTIRDAAGDNAEVTAGETGEKLHTHYSDTAEERHVE